MNYSKPELVDLFLTAALSSYSAVLYILVAPVCYIAQHDQFVCLQVSVPASTHNILLSSISCHPPLLVAS